ncbi:hypothetical protein RUM44_003059 [Polyplax serrata]|uniref:Polycomb protein VEFS-Box domain-containing protein n=1 Tax=Polyplax serrata TaxID=468196 RepID=A0ABR1AXW6_POLSC
MPPKKKDRDDDGSKNRPADQYQADHELFLNAFEKPTQIYRFLRTRNMISPIFLNRTLSYMKQRMSRDHKGRKTFKVNNILSRLRDRCQGNDLDSEKKFLTLTFLGFYDKTCTAYDEIVNVETSVTKISHKKRKDSSSPLVKLYVGTSEVPVNPSEDHPPSKAPTISIPSDSFNSSNGNLIKSYVLYLKVARSERNHYISANDELDTLEPSSKRARLAKEEVKYYGSELTVYDKHNRCLLMTGDYELGLQEIQSSSKLSPKKNSQWITMENTEDEAFEVFSKRPMIKFRLDWTSEPSDGLVDRPKPFRPNGQTLDVAGNKENRPEKCVSTSNIKGKNKIEPQRLQIVYQFLYNNNSRQQTEACDDLICPWCSLNCMTLYSLLKHLKLCHSRFTFTYNQISQGARIDVAINECYDGSYTGSPHDLISQPPGFAFSRNGPVRRTSVTNILVCRPKRLRPSLTEFLELEENDFDGQRPYITGHNRLYHHTTTCLPVYPKEMDIDSEGENDPKWLQQKTIMMIDDFTDVNEGEKELMKLWNLHVMKHGYVGDCQIPLACLMFIKSKGDQLVKKNLYRNFVLHVCNLFDFGLISSQTVYMIIRQLQDLIKKDPEHSRLLKKTWTTQRKNWLSLAHKNPATWPTTETKNVVKMEVTTEDNDIPAAEVQIKDEKKEAKEEAQEALEEQPEAKQPSS